MSSTRSPLFRSLWLVLALIPACTTTVYKDGVDVTAEEEARRQSEKEAQKPSTALEIRIAETVEALGYDHGSKLLRDLQFLVAQKELAVEPILAMLPRADLRSRANLLYVLGFVRTPDTTQALTDHLGHADAAVRFEAAAGLLNHGDGTAVPILVDFLESPDKRVRYKAIESLRSAVGLDFGFNFQADEDTRAVAVGKWRNWWKIEKERLMYRPWSEKPASAQEPASR